MKIILNLITLNRLYLTSPIMRSLQQYTYEINLQRSIDFYDHHHYETIFKNFNPIYYMNSYWGVRVLKNHSKDEEPPCLEFQLSPQIK